MSPSPDTTDPARQSRRGDRQTPVPRENPDSQPTAGGSLPPPPPGDGAAGAPGGHDESANSSDGASGRILHRINDIRDEEELVRYAAAAQLARLTDKGISQATVVKVLSINAANLSHALAGRARLSTDTLREIDKASVALASDLDHTAGLAQFGVRMRGLVDRASLTTHVPPNYFVGTTARSENELQVMTQASDLLDRFLTAEKAARGRAALLRAHESDIKEIVKRLILIAGAPPSPRNIEAQILLGSLAKYAFEQTLDQMEDSLRHTALGFRVWRALTKMLLLSQDDARRGDTILEKNLKPRVRNLLSEASTLRQHSLYPGRSLDLELAISLPANWLQPTASVTDMLLARAMDKGATLRERGTAAHGLWQRACATGRTDEGAQTMMRELIADFREGKNRRPDITTGLEWVATTLEYLVDNDQSFCNEWPAVDEPWRQAVDDSADMLSHENIPAWVRDGTRKLFEHMLLQNAGVERRKAIDAVGAGGYVEPVARALSKVLRDQRAEGWLRIRAIFALGFMQHRSPTTSRALTYACLNAIEAVQVAPEDDVLVSQINELHTVLFAIGDCYGALGAEEDARDIRDNLRTQLQELVEDERLKTKEMYSVARALVYLLTFTAQNRRDRDSPKDISQDLLKILRKHPDRITKEFSQWALRFRFNENGEVCPILHAAS